MNPASLSFAPYLSRLQLERLRESGGQREVPVAEGLAGALLFLDAVDFTGLTERLSIEGPRGAERLGDVLRAHFSDVLDTIDGHGGDVLFFAGDALVSLWRSAPGDSASLAGAAATAGRCSLAIQRAMARITPLHGVRLAFRASIAAGGLEAIEVGGGGGRWLQLVRGEPLAAVRHADRLAGAGDVIVTASWLAAVRGRIAAEVEPVSANVFRVRSIAAASPAPSPVPQPLPAAIEALLERYVPRVVAERVRAGQVEWLAEFRQVSVLFVNLSDAAMADASELGVLHDAVVAIQEEVARREGVVDQLLEDDKGTSTVIAFGLPGSSHADDAARAVLAARAIEGRLKALGVRVACGVATGPVFCGLHGGGRRLHYSLLGSPINLAARLMQDAAPGVVLTDEATRDAAAARIAFVPRGTATPKGFAQPIPVWLAQDRLAEAALPAGGGVIIGRHDEEQRLHALLDGIEGAEHAKVAIIEADAGMGKSMLLGAFEGALAERGIRMAHGAADSLEAGTPYYAFRRVVRGWLDLDPALSPAAARAAVQARLDGSPEHAPLAPLLNAVLALGFADTELTRQLRGEVRAENLRRVLLHIAAERTRERPEVLCLDDCHWMDSASWNFLSGLVREVPGLVVILSTRPMPEPPAVYEQLKARPDTEAVPLAPLSADAIARLIRNRLGVEEVPASLLDLIAGRAEGNPFFAHELLRSLMEAGSVRVADGMCTHDEDVGGARLPATLEGVITARIDRLAAGPQLTLKVASVIGRDFDRELLENVHPAGASPGELDAHLDALAAAELIFADRSAAATAHSFVHALTHEATYGLLPFAQREHLHRSTAEAMESSYADNLAPVQARLAHHFRMAGMAERAIPHLAGAGEQALDAYASRDAVRLLTQALDLDHDVRGELRYDLARARWSRQIAQAWYYQDDHDRAREWFEAAVRRTGTQSRAPLLGAVTSVPRLLVAGAAREDVNPRVTIGERERTVEAIRSMRELAAVYLWQTDQVAFLRNALEMANAARRIGPSSESPYAVSVFSFLLSVIGMRGRAEKEGAKAVVMAEESTDLVQIAITNIVRGMVLTNHGRFESAVTNYARAEHAADELRAGPTKHRSKFQFAEALLWLGQYDRSRRLFETAAHLSASAEPHVVGFANSMAALTLLRQGRLGEAISRLEREDAIPFARKEGVVLSLICGLGVLAEARLAAGDAAGALDAVREAEESVRPTDDGTGYFPGILGYGSLMRVRILLGVEGERDRGGRRRLTRLDWIAGRVQKLARSFPGGRSRLLYLTGLRLIRDGKPEDAKEPLEKAIKLAEKSRLPYELCASCMALASIGSAARRDELTRKARDVAAAAGLDLAIMDDGL